MTGVPTITVSNQVLQDMLGAELYGALSAARARLGDDTVLVRIEAGRCIVSRGAADLQGGLSADDALTYLGAMS